MADIDLSNQKNFIRVNFTNRGFAKIMRRNESVSDDSPDKQNILGVAELLSEAKVPRGKPIKFKTLPEFLGLDYVGYIIEKERLDKDTGEWVRIDEFKIIGSEASSFVDTRVAYGYSYRYRIKTVIKVSRAEVRRGLSHLEALEDMQEFERRRIQKALKKNKARFENLDNEFLGVESKTSGGRKNEEIELADGVTVVANESSTDVRRDRHGRNNDNHRSLRNSRVEDHDMLRGRQSRQALQKQLNRVIERFRERKIDHFSTYYESNASRNWLYVDVIETEPPPPPQTIKIVPCSPKKEIVISWLKPANAQRDIKYFKLYRRTVFGQPWKLLTEAKEIDIDSDGFPDAEPGQELLPSNTNLFIDKNVEFGVQYIYALSSVDVHDTESFLSIQTGAMLNPNYALEKQEKPLKWISGSGIRPDEVDFVFKKFLNRTEQIIAKESIYIAPTTKFAETEKHLIIKIRSLDTHEVRELKVVLKNTNVKETLP